MRDSRPLSVIPAAYRHSRESGNPPPALSVRRGWPGWWLGAYLPHPTLSRWERAGGLAPLSDLLRYSGAGIAAGSHPAMVIAVRPELVAG